MASFTVTETEEEQRETEEEVLNDTEAVVRHFMLHRFQDRAESQPDTVEYARPDALEEIISVNDTDPSSPIARVGVRLGEVGDEINLKYRDQFKDMIEHLNLTPNSSSEIAYQSFSAVARRLFSNGINWGRIVALLCFGFEIAMTVIRRGLSGSFLRRIITFVVAFIIDERISRWIAENGGWMGIFNFRLTEPSWLTVGAVAALSTLLVLWITGGPKTK